MTASTKIRPLRHASTSTGLHRRWKIGWPAVLHTAHGRVPCRIENVSTGGAQLVVGSALLDDESVSLLIHNFGAIDARIAWRRRDRIGLQFAVDHPWIVDLVKKAAMEDTSAGAR
jgi:hypothetical protein